MSDNNALTCLWLSRFLPARLNAGDAIYTRRVVEALAAGGLKVTVMGLPDLATTSLKEADPLSPLVSWVEAPGDRGSKLKALLSPLPLEAARYGAPAYRRALDQQLERKWDIIVLDHYGSGWALDVVARKSDAPIVYVSHNFETEVSRAIAEDFRGDPARKVALKINAAKVRRLEHRLTARADLTVCNTLEDQDAYHAGTRPRRTTVSAPGYDRARVPERRIDAHVPRRVVIVGSYRWIAKEMNLDAFLTAADAIFDRAGVQLDVIGDASEAFHARWQGRLKATRLRGFVDDLPLELAQSRMGLVVETTGGGFKHKVLDYAFTRTPIGAITGSLAGIPSGLRESVLFAPTAEALALGVVEAIDDLDLLNTMQSAGYAAVDAAFNWRENALHLLEQMRSLPRRAAT